MTNALKILLTQQRFDLIFKYLYAQNPTDFNRTAYLESIRAFNGGHETELSDGVPKESLQDFIDSYDRLLVSIKSKGFDSSVGRIPVQRNGEISDGAHRLSACAAYGVDIETIDDDEHSDIYSFQLFEKRRMDKRIMDYGALEYVKLNPNAHIVNLQSITDPCQDDKVIVILEKYGFVFYKKNVHLTLNGYINLKKISYGSFWDRESWIGTNENGFAGAVMHAKQSMGKNPCRVFVFVCDDLEKVLQAKSEIRELYKIGNFSVHINDTHDEAIWLAEAYFNENSLFWINNCPYKFEDKNFDDHIEFFKKVIKSAGLKSDDFCCVGSTVLNAFGIRHADDVDYLTIADFAKENEIISPHDNQLQYYPIGKRAIITEPSNHFYYHGMKIYTLSMAFKMKLKRGEKKDIKDCARMLALYGRTLKLFLRNQYILVMQRLRKQAWLTKPYMCVKNIIKNK